MKTQQLKNAVLQSAFRGELLNIEVKLDAKRLPFPSNKNDLYDTSSDLLTIPSHWKWIKIEDAFEVARGGSPRPIKSFITNDANGINWIKIGDTLKGGKYITATKEKIIPEGVKKSRFVKKGDFILSNSMSFGRPYILDIDGCIHDGWLVLSQKKEYYNKDFLYYLLSSPLVYNQFLDKVSGAVVNNLNALKVKSVWIPYLSLDEQIKIVEKIESLFEQIELYNQKKIHLDDFQKNFPSQIEKSIIQYSIQGKLVKQDISDEPASKLLKRIFEQKEQMVKDKIIKQEKILPPITGEEIPFDIPDSWEWVRIKDIYYNDGQIKPDQTFYYVDVSAIDNKKGAISKDIKLTSKESAPSRARKITSYGDILYSTVRPYLKNIAVVDVKKDKPLIASTAFVVMRPIEIYNEYLYYVLKSPYFDNEVKHRAQGVAYPAINDTNFNSLLVPIPPLNEQHRIVSKLKSILVYIDKLTSV